MLGARNIFDHYQLVGSFPEVDRSFYVNLRVQLC